MKMHILWHYLLGIFQVAIQYWRGFQPPMAPTTVQEKSNNLIEHCRNYTEEATRMAMSIIEEESYKFPQAT